MLLAPAHLSVLERVLEEVDERRGDCERRRLVQLGHVLPQDVGQGGHAGGGILVVRIMVYDILDLGLC